ncbi:hypothetical protein CA850_20355 [Micromonospora echinospora]|uniref:Uncharacterized protein n=1 Tax=Micromonospora echinospora TaxID=1877 RepID=A0A1C4Z870_MICEC|nr:hypothetical protein CA850_20355 [Micromonospora echinospora]SCF29057.1 hypothetical protein GA0070618_4880 [Micromonospora echinospora]
MAAAYRVDVQRWAALFDGLMDPVGSRFARSEPRRRVRDFVAGLLARLPAEHRAAHLIDITRAHLDLGDHRPAGRALVAVDRIALAEMRLRPVAHAALAAVLRAGANPVDLTRLATTLGLTRPRVG